VKIIRVEVQEALFSIKANLKHHASSMWSRFVGVLTDTFPGDTVDVTDPVQLYKEARRVQSATTHLLHCDAIQSDGSIIQNIHVPYIHPGSNAKRLGITSKRRYRLNDKSCYRFRVHAFDAYGNRIKSSRWSQEQPIEEMILWERLPLQVLSGMYPSLESSLDYFCDKFVVQRAPINVPISFKGLTIEVEHSALSRKLEEIRRSDVNLKSTVVDKEESRLGAKVKQGIGNMLKRVEPKKKR